MTNESKGEPTTEKGTGSDAGTRHRVQLDFSKTAFQRLNSIRERADVKTTAELVRNALRLFEWYMEQREGGYKIQVTKDGQIKEIEFGF
jgi:hypothetical protein